MGVSDPAASVAADPGPATVPPALAAIREQVLAAAAAGTPLEIRGGGTKAFYGNAAVGTPLAVSGWQGIVEYEPTELVVTARCGTPLVELEAALAARGQFLPFEPPAFGEAATIGGVVAAGLSGPRRASAGAVRDYVRGASLLDARGRLLHFGGQVMTIVAGYDVSRVLAGSLGMLGVITEVSLKVLPLPPAETTVALKLSQADLIGRLNRWAAEPLPLSASLAAGEDVLLRLSGARAAVEAAVARFARDHGAAPVEAERARRFWTSIREHAFPFFTGSEPLWRLSVPADARWIDLPGRQLVEWGGALRWYKGESDPARVRAAAAAVGGSATLFRGGDRSQGVFDPLPAPLHAIHARLKQAFDPNGIFNRGRLVAGL